MKVEHTHGARWFWNDRFVCVVGTFFYTRGSSARRWYSSSFKTLAPYAHRQRGRVRLSHSSEMSPTKRHSSLGLSSHSNWCGFSCAPQRSQCWIAECYFFAFTTCGQDQQATESSSSLRSSPHRSHQWEENSYFQTSCLTRAWTQM